MVKYKFDFFNDDNNIKLEWVSNSAKEYAYELTKEVKIWNSYKKKDEVIEKCLSATQLRNFYNEFLRIRDLPVDSKNKLVQIKLLEAKVKYKKTNKPKEMKKIFVDLISKLVNQIGDSIERFNNSCLIMEAIVGYFPRNK